MKFALFISVFLITISSFSQVGIGTTSPNAQLDIRSSSQGTPLNIDGILIPKIDNFPTINPTSSQDGMMVYFTGSSTFSKGFYYWDHPSSKWQAVGSKKIDDLSDGKSDSNGSSIFLGMEAGLVDNGTNNKNVGVGYRSLYSNVGNIDGYNNTALGYASLYSNTTGGNNTAIGYNVLRNNLAGYSNTAIGSESLAANIGSYNTAIGSQSLKENTDGTFNIAIGYSALYNNTTANNNTAIGSYALKENVTGKDNTAIGYESLLKNTTGTNNTAIGVKSLNQNTTGDSNTSNGNGSLKSNTIGSSNTASGYQSLSRNTSGDSNTANGSVALFENTEGINNTATGFGALNKNISGGFNTANGSSALFSNTTGSYNTAYGNVALYSLNNGEKNTAIGFEVLTGLTDGSNNTAIGKTTGVNLISGSGNVLIGSNSGGTETAYDNKLYIENSNSDTPLIGGNFATDMVGINRPIGSLTHTFEVGGEASKASAGDWVANSDRRLKTNIHSIDLSTALEKISKMNGVSYEWNDTQTGMPRPEGIQYGFIAQELMEVFPEKVTKDNQGFYQTAYGTYDAFYVQAIKELKQEIDKKESRITELEINVNQLQGFKAQDEKIENLENRLKKLEALLINNTVSKN